MSIDHAVERERYTQLILRSPATHKLIAAGAGTGKSYTFRELLRQTPAGDRLVLTFINNLASGLKRDLEGLADSRTFHSFSKKLLHRLPSPGITTSFHFYPLLEMVVREDAAILGADQTLPSIDFGDALRTLQEDDGRIRFFLERAGLYDAVGFDDSVYRVLRCFQDEAKIPSHALLLVDEFQDFNQLEVQFIERLATKAPTVVVGDDDQAVYDFRNASPMFLREKARDQNHIRFQLPYCSRCTVPVVEATNAVIENAHSAGYLQGRLEKPYVCYEPEKGADSRQYPRIVRPVITAQKKDTPYVARYIANVLRSLPAQEIEQAADPERGYPLGLVIGPPDRYYLKMLHEHLRDEFLDVVYLESKKRMPDATDGYGILCDDPDANLGWRILVGSLDQPALSDAVRQSHGSAGRLRALLNQAWVTERLHIVGLVRKLKRSPELLTEDERRALSVELSETIEIVAARLKASVDSDASDSPRKHPTVQICTFNGAKGLSGGFVFVVGLEEGTLPKSNCRPTDNEICQFIVALTRARKQCHLISVGRLSGRARTASVFPTWIPNSLVKHLRLKKGSPEVA